MPGLGGIENASLEGLAGGLAPEVSVPEWKPMGALGMLGVDFHFGIGTSSIYAVGSRRHIGLRDDRARSSYSPSHRPPLRRRGMRLARPSPALRARGAPPRSLPEGADAIDRPVRQVCSSTSPKPSQETLML